jgi:hypothetical protein
VGLSLKTFVRRSKGKTLKGRFKQKRGPVPTPSDEALLWKANGQKSHLAVLAAAREKVGATITLSVPAFDLPLDTAQPMREGCPGSSDCPNDHRVFLRFWTRSALLVGVL